MAIISTSSGNSIVTAELVRTVWNDYVSNIPSFLHSVTLHIQELDNVGSAGKFQFIVPNYIPGQGNNNYFTTIKNVSWNEDNLHPVIYKINQYDNTLLMNNTEYRMNFVKSVLIKILLSFEKDFANTLQDTIVSTAWNTILPILPKTNTFSVQNSNFFESKQVFWYLSNNDAITQPSYQVPALGFISGLSSYGGWIFHSCSQYARFLGLQEPQLACSPAVMEAICTEYSVDSSTSALIGQKVYNAPGAAISNGYLTAYSLPGLQVAYDALGWTQGVMFRIVNVGSATPNTTTFILQCITKTANLLANGTFTLSKYTPLIFSVKKFTPTVEQAIGETYNFDSGYWATMTSNTDINITSGFINGSAITVTVNNDQITLPGDGAFPMINYSQISPNTYQNIVVTTPWRPENFGTFTSAATRMAHTGANTLHYSYLYDKANTHAFVVKQRAVGGGIESTEQKVTDKVPFMVFEKGEVLEGVNEIRGQGIMAMSTIPQLGGQLIAWSPYPSATAIPMITTKYKKDGVEIGKYDINLDHRLISYSFDMNDTKVIESQHQFIIPLNAYDITLIADYSKNNDVTIKDPILDAIERGLTPDKLSSETFAIYKSYFSENKKEGKTLKRKKHGSD